LQGLSFLADRFLYLKSAIGSETPNRFSRSS
jgi:hypothetical protein